MYLENIDIENFRGFEKLKLERFKKVNLFLGQNNCGKTSLLEALFLVTGISNPQLSININAFRDLPFLDEEDFRYLFHDLDYNVSPKLIANFSEKELQRILEVIPIFKEVIPTSNELKKINQNELSSSAINSNDSGARVSGLTSKFSIKEKHKERKNYKSQIYLQPGGLTIDQPRNYRETINGVFLRSGVNESSAIQRLEKIIQAKKQDNIVKILQEIDPRIRDIVVLSNSRIFFDIADINHLVPSNIMGDGIRRILSMITTIWETSNGIVFIDEIENGLHYSAHEKLWKAILAASEEFNVQLFITTHNIETLERLRKVVIDQSFQKEIKAYSLKVVKNRELKAFEYGFEEFAHAINQEIEIR